MNLELTVRWRSCESEPPELPGWYIAGPVNGYVSKGILMLFSKSSNDWTYDDDGIWETCNPKWWMPMIPLPKEDANEKTPKEEV